MTPGMCLLVGVSVWRGARKRRTRVKQQAVDVRPDGAKSRVFERALGPFLHYLQPMKFCRNPFAIHLYLQPCATNAWPELISPDSVWTRGIAEAITSSVSGHPFPKDQRQKPGAS